jgi:hypothetical protein
MRSLSAAHTRRLGDAVGQGDLGDHRGDLRVLGGELHDVTAGGGRAPEGDPLGVDLVELARAGDRGPPVLELGLVVDELARLAFARSEVPVVEHQCREPGLREARAVGVQPLLADSIEAVADHDTGHGVVRVGVIEPGGAPSALALDDEVITPH